MFLKREKPETDDFVVTKYLVVKKKVCEYTHPNTKNADFFIFFIFLRFRGTKKN